MPGVNLYAVTKEGARSGVVVMALCYKLEGRGL
jgi:hypothetical protein